jgi:hypothetical protein
MSRVIAVMACGFTLAACSTSMPSLEFLKPSARTDALRIESAPPGAEAKTSLGQSCRTPCELQVQAGGELSVTVALDGYQPQTVSVQPEAPSGALGSITGSPRLAPNPLHVELQPAPAPPAKKPAAKKKKPVAASRPAAAPAPVASAATPAPVPVPEPPAEAAASATNYPWPSR